MSDIQRLERTIGFGGFGGFFKMGSKRSRER